jgi:hypothetical protein
MPDPLPKLVASLSKYYRVEDHYKLISSILHNTPESDLREQFDRDLYATAKQRYLIVRDGTVYRDKLVDLVHEEDGFTERVKMVMYFLFMFRDARYRRFICERVGNREGKWQTSIFHDSTSEYFEHAGGRKAFTNLRQFLFQTGILDEESLHVHIPELAGWFPTAVEVAAQSIEDVPARKSFLASPTDFLVKHKVNALLNANPAELAADEFTEPTDDSEDDDGVVPELPDAKSLPDGSEFRDWKRSMPLQRNRKASVVETNPAALERANDQHSLLEQRIFELCKENKLKPRNNIHVDLRVDFGAESVLFEMKSCRAGKIRNQLRKAISQLLEYRYIYRNELQPNVVLCAVLERKPGGRAGWLAGYIDSLGIGLIWKNDHNDKLNCTDETKRLLKKIFPEIGLSNF